MKLAAVPLIAGLMISSAFAQQQTVVQYRTWLDPSSNNPRSVAQNQIVAEFEKRNPTIKIELQLMAWQQMHTSIIRDAAAGTAPCLVRPYFETMPEIVRSGALAPLDRFVGDVTPAEKSDYLIDWNATVFNGHKMSFPLEHRLLLLLYRKDLLEKAGKSVPKTWDEFATVAKAVTARGVYGSTVPLSAKGSAEGFYQWLFPFVWGSGDEFFDKNGKAVVTPGLLHAMHYLHDGAHGEGYLPPSIVSDDVEAMMSAFMAGRLAMIVLGSNRLSTVLQSNAVKDKVGVATLPSPDGQKPSPTIVSGWQIAMTKDCKTPDAAWKFIQHITSPEMTLLNSKIGGELPIRKSALSDPWFDSPEARDTRFAADYMAQRGRPQMLVPNFTLFVQSLATAAQKIVGEDAPIEATLRGAIDQYNAQAGTEH